MRAPSTSDRPAGIPSPRLAVAGALISAGMAVAAVLSWTLGSWNWLMLRTGRVPMAPSTAVLLLVVNAAVLAALCRRESPGWRRFSWAAAVAVSVVGLAALLRPFFGWASPVEQWLAGTTEAIGGVSVGQMSPLTGFALALLGCAVVCRHAATPAGRWASWLDIGSSLLAAWTGGMVIVGYAAGTPLFHNRPVIPMALWTAIAILCTGGAIALAHRGAGTTGLSSHSRDEPTPDLRPVWSRSWTAVLAVMAATIVTVGWFLLRWAETSARAAAQQQLQAIAALKANQIANWRNERLRDAEFVFGSDLVTATALALLTQPEHSETTADLHRLLGQVKAHTGCDQVLWFDPESQLRLALPPWPGNPDSTDRLFAANVLRTGQPMLTDPYRSTDTDAIHLDLAIPLVPYATRIEGHGPTAGTLVLRIDARRAFFPLVQQWPLPSRTAEALLVKPEGDQLLYLNDLRHDPDAALRLRLPADPRRGLVSAVIVARSGGVAEGVDYRGVNVVAAGHPIPGTAWFLVAKVNEEEIYQSIYQQTWLALALMGVLLTTATLFVWVVTQRNELFAERQRAALAERVALLMRQANDSIVLADDGYRIIDANERAAEMYGCSLAELQRMTLPDLRAPETRERFAEEIADVTENGALIQTVHRRKDGRTIPVESSARWVYMAGRRFLQVIVRDITERAEADRRRRITVEVLELLNRSGPLPDTIDGLLGIIQREMGVDAVGIRLRSGEDFPYYAQIGFAEDFVVTESPLCNRAPDGTARRDEEGRVVLDCTCGLVISGCTDPTAPGFTPGGSFWSNDTSAVSSLPVAHDATARGRNRCVRDGYHSVALVPIRRADAIVGLLQLNDRRRGGFSSDTIRFLEGIAASIGVAIGRSQDADQLAAAAREWRETFDAVNDAVWVLDAEQRIVRSNRVAERFFGRALDQMIGRHCWEIVHGTSHPIAGCPVVRMKVSRRRETMELAVGERWLEITVDPLFDYAGGLIGGVHLVSDITERKRVDAALRDEGAFRASVIERAAEGLCVCHAIEEFPFVRFTVWNARMVEISGYTMDEINRRGWYQTVYPDPEYRERAIARMDRMRQGDDLIAEEWEIVRANGRKRTLLISTSIVSSGTGPPHILALMNDITERKRDEERLARLVDDLRHANRVKSEFVATMSHELRTPLNIIIGYTDLLLEDAFGAVTSEQHDTLVQVGRSASDLLALINATLDFSRLESGRIMLQATDFAPADLADELEREIRSLHERTRVPLVWEVSPGLPVLHTDRVQLKSVIKNLIENALKFTDTGRVTVRMRAAAGGVEITVSDTGIGIAPDILPVIFEPFRQGDSSSTRTHGGVGLGLYIVHQLLEALGGWIDVQSQVGYGSTFRAWVPERTKMG